MLNALSSRIILITGERQVGKSTALFRTVTTLRQADLRVSGLLTRRTGPHDLEVTEVHTNTTYPLTAPFTPTHTSPTRGFAMNTAAMQRSATALTMSFPTDVFVLDEIGPLELIHRQGWIESIDLLHRSLYGVAFIVIRPGLLGEAIAELPGPSFGLVRVTPDNRDIVPNLLYRLALSTESLLRSSSLTPSEI